MTDTLKPTILPDCMASDGADPCRAYQLAIELYKITFEEKTALESENAKMKERLDRWEPTTKIQSGGTYTPNTEQE